MKFICISLLRKQAIQKSLGAHDQNNQEANACYNRRPSCWWWDTSYSTVWSPENCEWLASCTAVWWSWDLSTLTLRKTQYSWVIKTEARFSVQVLHLRQINLEKYVNEHRIYLTNFGNVVKEILAKFTTMTEMAISKTKVNKRLMSFWWWKKMWVTSNIGEDTFPDSNRHVPHVEIRKASQSR